MTPSGEALRFVASRRFATCRARRACLVEDGTLAQMERWADTELRAFEALPDDAAREVWRTGLASRTPPLWTAPPAPPVTATRPPSVSPLVLEQIERTRDGIAELDRVRPMIEAAQRGLTRPRDGSAPAVCRGDLREQLQQVIREGLASSSLVATLRRQLDDICQRWERWEQPDTRVEARYQRMVSHLDRVDGWMNDIIRCHEPGPYDGRCHNTFGDPEPGAVAQARLAMRETAATRRVLARAPGGRRFPCNDPRWQRVMTMSWTLSTAAAQMPDIGRNAMRVCEAIGIETAELEQLWQRTQDIIERLRAQVAEQRNTQVRALENLERMQSQ